MLIDTHAHLTMEQFSDLGEVVKRAKDSGVGAIINVGFDLQCSKDCVGMARENEMMYAAVGVHPHHADTVDDKAISELKVLAEYKKVVAMGETGLDYFENPVPKNAQKEAFLKHISLAKELNLPLIFHGRESGEEMLKIIQGEGKGDLNGVFHCFSEDKKFARKVLDLGFLVSFTAIITFKNAHRMREVVEYVPLEKIMVETDCPYLAPQIFRGKRNEPSYIRFVAEKIAEIKRIPIEDVEETTTSNARSFFKL